MIAQEKFKFRIKGTSVYVAPVTRANAYTAAGTGRRAANWTASALGPKTVLEYNIELLRRRSRQAVRNDGIADSGVEIIATQVVGSGIRPNFSTSDDGINTELANLWDDWINESDADGILNFYGQQKLLCRSVAEGGDCFGRFRLRRIGEMRSVPLQVQLLESEHCPSNLRTVPFQNIIPGNDISQGIEFNRIGKRVAYWMFRRHPGDAPGISFTNPEASIIPVRVPSDQVMHVFNARRPGQVRGEPWLTRALITLLDLDTFQDATLVRQKTATLFTGFVTKPVDAMFGGEDSVEDDPFEEGVSNVTMQPGSLIELDQGQEVVFNSPPDVGQTYEPYTRVQQRYIASAIGVLYEQLTGDYTNTTDRQYRAALGEFRRKARSWQIHMMIHQWCRPVVNRFIDLAIIAGKINPKGLEFRDLHKVIFIPHGWEYVHPVQDVQSDILKIRGGLVSRADVVAERGGDIETVDREQQIEHDRTDGFGLLYDSDGRQPKSGGEQEAKENPEVSKNQGGEQTR